MRWHTRTTYYYREIRTEIGLGQATDRLSSSTNLLRSQFWDNCRRSYEGDAWYAHFMLAEEAASSKKKTTCQKSSFEILCSVRKKEVIAAHVKRPA